MHIYACTVNIWNERKRDAGPAICVQRVTDLSVTRCTHMVHMYELYIIFI